jgi:hypothetical protein
MNLTLAFFGGPRDGEVLPGGSGCLQADEIQRQCHQSHDGVIGERINCATLYSETILETCSDSAINDFKELGCRFPNHTYEVLWRRVDGTEIRIGLSHLGIATGGKECRLCPLRDIKFPSC